jgi:hypothetical protein
MRRSRPRGPASSITWRPMDWPTCNNIVPRPKRSCAARAVWSRMSQSGLSGRPARMRRRPPRMRRPRQHRPIRCGSIAQVDAVLSRLHAQARQHRPTDGGPRRGAVRDPFHYADYGFSISPSQGELIYLLCRTLRATRVVEFATSLGVSTLYFASAIRDNGGGIVIGSEIVPQKVASRPWQLERCGPGWLGRPA